MQPGQFNPKGEDWIGRELAELRKELRELKAANVFGLTGIVPKDGGTDLDGFVNVNGPMTVNGETNVNGPLEVNGTANFTGTTTIGGDADITGNITQDNAWGASSLGPVVFGTGSPSLTFTKNGTSYGNPVGVGLTRDSTDSADQILVGGPAVGAERAFLYLRSDLTFALAAGAGADHSVIYNTPGANGTLKLWGGGTNGSINIFPTGTGNCQVNGAFAVTGTKAFIMDHPLNPDTMSLMHAATESPVNGVEYWGTATTGTGGTVTVELPTYFEALTKLAGRNIQLTPASQCAAAPWAGAITNGRFTVNASAGTKVYWLVKAERQHVVDGHDDLAFPAEQDKLIIGPRLPES